MHQAKAKPEGYHFTECRSDELACAQKQNRPGAVPPATYSQVSTNN